MASMTERGVPVYAPSGDWLLVHGVRLVDNSGMNHTRNYIVLDRIDKTSVAVAYEGTGYVALEVSEKFKQLHDYIAQKIDTAATNGTTADLRSFNVEEGDQFNPIRLIRK